MVNNFKQIIELLDYPTEDVFYFCQIMQRSKDNPDIGKNNRVIKEYFFNEDKRVEDRMEEIIKMCEVFNARCYIDLTKRSYRKVTLDAMQKVIQNVVCENWRSSARSFSSSAGGITTDPNKKWVIDLDGYEAEEQNVSNIINFIDSLQPLGSKLIAQIPTKNGIHLITSPFNLMEFKKVHPTIDVHKKNPTLAFCL